MYAEVYPMKRLPRRFGTFTYEIPADSKQNVRPGTFVHIPWRSQTLEGIVASTHDRKPEYPTKPLTDVMERRPLPEGDVQLYTAVARDTFQSVSTVLATAFPKARKRGKANIQHASHTTMPSIRSEEVDYLRSILTAKPGGHFVQTQDLLETGTLAHLFYQTTGKPILLVAPHEHDATVLAQTLAHLDDVTVCTSERTPQQRSDLAQAWRLGEIRLFITTRAGILFPPPENLGAIILARAGVPEHAQYDRNPRFDARQVARAWGDAREVPVLLCDTAPRVHELVGTQAHWSPITPGARAVNMHEAVRISQDPLLSEEALELIAQTRESGGRILVVSNKKNVAKRLTCSQCDFTETCSICKAPLHVFESVLYCRGCERVSPRPAQCRSCKKPALEERGRGNRSALSTLKERFPEAKISIIEKGTKQVSDADILVATHFYHEQFYHPSEDRFAAVIILNAEELHGRGRTELEVFTQHLHEYLGISYRSQCPILIQTWDYNLTNSLILGTKEALENEMQARKEFVTPPFVQEVEIEAERTPLMDLLEKTFPSRGEIDILETDRGVRLRAKNFQAFAPLQSWDDAFVIKNTTYLC